MSITAAADMVLPTLVYCSVRGFCARVVIFENPSICKFNLINLESLTGTIKQNETIKLLTDRLTDTYAGQKGGKNC